jgi:hypothetical protein
MLHFWIPMIVTCIIMILGILCTYIYTHTHKILTLKKINFLKKICTFKINYFLPKLLESYGIRGHEVH